MHTFDPFDTPPRKVHLYHDQKGATYGVAKCLPFASTLCKMNSAVPDTHITADPAEVTCKICRADRRFPSVVTVRTPAVETPPSRPIDFIEPSRLMTHHSVPMIIYCPICAERHIDEGEFAEKPHHTHACQSCGHVWRPAKLNTHGVRFLPGYKNVD